VDVKLLSAAINVSDILVKWLKASCGRVYSLHKESTSAYIQKYVKENHPGLEAELLHKISFDLPSTYKFHKKSKIKAS
jgi:predicted RNA methylase